MLIWKRKVFMCALQKIINLWLLSITLQGDSHLSCQVWSLLGHVGDRCWANSTNLANLANSNWSRHSQGIHQRGEVSLFHHSKVNLSRLDENSPTEGLLLWF
jgi:hypothetical protein